ncbi:hypothetical protein GF412_01505 [Candidatus Micrarchaeota archaeon]|nr:hypothetical protein [Candidatus Micrarchaeota archaeon]MBD3417644.1 hypothetical protein [Candidatus Micrarchaeota archaeon]
MDRNNMAVIGAFLLLVLIILLFFGAGGGPASCGSDADCPEGELCGPDGTCGAPGGPGAPCADGGDCAEGLICLNGICQVPEPDPCEGVTCVPPQVCYEGECVDEECVGIDCPEGEECVDGECVDEECIGVECPEGEECVEGECVPDCECGPEEVCVSTGPDEYACIPFITVPECLSNDDCEIGYVCVDGQCEQVTFEVSCFPPCEAYEVCLNGACIPLELVSLQTECDECPDPNSTSTMMFLGYDAQGEAASVAIAAQTDTEGRQPVKDATVFVTVFYDEENYDICRVTTSETGEAVFNYSTGPYAACGTNGCTIRFTFCCANISTGCMIPLCLNDPGITSYDDGIPPCPDYDDTDWPMEATVQDEFVPLFPSLDEFTIPKPPDLGFGSFSFSFCLPILVIFGLLGGAMFASGRNPFAGLSFYTPRFKGLSPYTMRARGLTWNIQGIINKVTYAAQGASRKASGKEKPSEKEGAKGEGKAEGAEAEGGKAGTPEEPGKVNLAAGGAEGQQLAADAKGAKMWARLSDDSQVFKAVESLGAAMETGNFGQKLGAGLGFVGLTASTLFLTRLGMTVAPLMSGTYALVEVIGGAMNEAGIGAVAERAQKMRENMDVDISETADRITVSLNRYGDPDDRVTQVFDKTPEGRKKMAEFMGKQMGEIEVSEATATKLIAEISRQNATAVALEMTENNIEVASMDAAGKEVVAEYAGKDGKLSKGEYQSGARREAAEAVGLEGEASEKRSEADRLGKGAQNKAKEAEQWRQRAEGAKDTKQKQEFLAMSKTLDSQADEYRAEQAGLMKEAKALEQQADQHYSNIADLALAAESTGGFVSTYYGEHIAEKARAGELTAEEYKIAALVLAKSADEGAYSAPTKAEMKAYQEEAQKLREIGVRLGQPTGEMDYGTESLASGIAYYQSDSLSTLGGVSGVVGRNIGAGTDIAVGASAAAAAGEQLGGLGRALNESSLISLANMSEHGQYSFIPAGKKRVPPGTNPYADAMSGYGSITSPNNPTQFLIASKKAEMADKAIMERVEYNAMVGADPGIAEQYAYKSGMIDDDSLNKMRSEGPAALYARSTNESLSSQERDEAKAKLERLFLESRLQQQGLSLEDYGRPGLGIGIAEFTDVIEYESAQIDRSIAQGNFDEMYEGHVSSNQSKVMGFAGKEFSSDYNSIPITPEGYPKDVA